MILQKLYVPIQISANMLRVAPSDNLAGVGQCKTSG